MKLIKYLFLLIAFVLWPAVLISQVIETVPAFPTINEPLTIIFDATEAERSDLVGHDGEVYAHTGVIFSEGDKDSGAWSYVVTDWGENTPETQLTNIGDDLWELQIDDIREYYGVPQSEQIFQIAILFRSGNVLSDGRQTDDLFIDLFEDELQVRFTKPSVSPLNPYFTERDETVEFEIVGNSPQGTLSTIQLLRGDDLVASVSDSDTLTANYTVTQTGRTDFRAVAEDASGETAETDLFIIVNPEVNRQARPQGIEDGITYHEDGSTVTFSIFAPYKEFVYLIGDHSDWEVDEEYFMNLDAPRADSTHFWITVDDFTPGETYRFQYFVDGEIRTADLFSELVLHPSRDQQIPSSVYPNMPQYPSGLTTDYVSVIEPGRDNYQWEVPDFERPEVDELVVYELLLRDFVEHSTFDTLADTLGYLENLGVNVVELMPVQEFDGNLSWGYNPVFHGALDKSYGNRESFKRFVDEAHKRGMAVVLDVVYNHAQDDSPLIRTFGSNRAGSFAAGNPLLGPGHAYNVFFHLNHDQPYIKYWLDRMNRYWVETYNIDGYRFDLTKGFASNVNNQSLLDGRNERRIENLKRMADELWSVDEDVYIILEHFAANSEERELAEYGMLLWGNHHFNYSEGVMGWNQGGNSDMSGIYYGNRNFEYPHLVGYMESHDEQWLMRKMRDFGNDSNPDHDPTELNTALQRMKLASAFFFTIPGPKMLWQFGELGYGWGDNECLRPGDGSVGDCSASDPGRTAEKPVRWEYYNEENRNRLYRSWSELTRLRNSSPVFTHRDTEFSSSLRGEFKWIRLENENMDALIVGNFGVERSTGNVEFTRTGEWHDFVTGTTLTVETEAVEFDLAPSEFKIFTSEPVEPAEQNVFLPVGEDGFGDLPDDFELDQNFPNPFNPTTQITYRVPEQADVELFVYDILGRQISTLVDESSHSAGTFTVTFDGSSLGSGVYITRLVSGDRSIVQKMTLIK